MNLFDAIASFFKTKPEGAQESLNLVQIKGNFKGEMNNGQQVLVSSTGLLKGKITTKSLEIYGLVEGNVAAENLLIRSSGRLHYSNLVYDDLFVEDGGILIQEGCRRQEEGCKRQMNGKHKEGGRIIDEAGGDKR